MGKAGPSIDLASRPRAGANSLASLRWLTIVLPIVFTAALQLAAMVLFEPELGVAVGHWTSVAILAAAVVVFSTTVFRILSGMQQRIIRQNEELSALNAVARAVSGSLNPRESLKRALHNVMEVTHASAGEITVEGYAGANDPISIGEGKAGALDELESLRGRVESHDSPGDFPGEVKIIETRVDPQGSHKPARGIPIYVQVPLRVQDHRYGVMRLLTNDPRHLGHDSERLLAAMGSQIAVAIQASRLFHDVLSRGREAQALYDIGLNITSLQDIQKILRSIVEHAREMLGSEAAALCLARPEGGLVLADYSGPREAFRQLPGPVIPAPVTLVTEADEPAMWARKNTCAVLANGYDAYHLSASLVVGASKIGELCVSSAAERTFSDRQREVLASLADMAAIAINNSRLLEREKYVAVLEERENLAREMHDSLAQVLGYLHLKAQNTKRVLAQNDAAKAEEELDDMATLAHEAYIDVREAILGLRETVSPAMGIAGTLKEYLTKYSRQAGIQSELKIDGDRAPKFSPEVEVQLVRVVQEALTNVRKHANASHVRVRMGRQEGGTVISVEDDGQGFDPDFLHKEDAHRFGLRTMRERVERVGGLFSVDSVPGKGTTVRINFPLVSGGNDDTRDGTADSDPSRR